MAKVFRIGPVFLAPLVLLWAVVSFASCPGDCQELWRFIPMYGALILAVLWHIALIITEKERKFYLAYAGVHLPVFYLFWGLALVLAVKFPL